MSKITKRQVQKAIKIIDVIISNEKKRVQLLADLSERLMPKAVTRFELKSLEVDNYLECSFWQMKHPKLFRSDKPELDMRRVRRFDRKRKEGKVWYMDTTRNENKDAKMLIELISASLQPAIGDLNYAL